MGVGTTSIPGRMNRCISPLHTTSTKETLYIMEMEKSDTDTTIAIMRVQNMIKVTDIDIAKYMPADSYILF